MRIINFVGIPQSLTSIERVNIVVLTIYDSQCIVLNPLFQRSLILMTMLNQETVQSVLDQIKSIRFLINEKILDNPGDEIDIFENNTALDELEACFTPAPHEQLEERITQFFSNRWNRIRNRSMCYTLNPCNLVNLLCLDLAKALSPLPKDESSIDELPPLTGPYFLLMPSLKVSVDAYGENIHRYRLHEFILSDDETVFIPIAKCLNRAIISDSGEFQHIVSEEIHTYDLLSVSEEKRLSRHSPLVADYMKAIDAYNIMRLHGNDIISQLKLLVNDLRAGGELEGGKNYDAGEKANAGIIKFFQFWDALSKTARKNFLATYPTFKDHFERLRRPNNTNFREPRFCVQLIADAIEGDIRKYSINSASADQALVIVNEKKQLFEQLIKTDTFVKPHSKTKPPLVLPMISALPSSEQQKIFRHAKSQDACSYALKHDPDVLTTFPTETLLNMAHNTKFINNMTALMHASLYGKEGAVKTLLALPIDLDQRDASDYTALMIAVKEGHAGIVDALLQQGADMTLRIRHGDAYGKSALDLALEYHPELVERLLLKAITLKIEQQKECLGNVSNKIYIDILAYAMIEHPEIFKKLYAYLIENNQNVKEVIDRFLLGLNFIEHFDSIRYKSNEMALKAANGRKNYTQAAEIAKFLVIRLANEMAGLLQTTEPLDQEKKVIFRKNCSTYIKEALSVLGEHRGWKKVNLTFLMILGFPVALPLYAAGMFSIQTDSAKKLLDFDSDLKEDKSKCLNH